VTSPAVSRKPTPPARSALTLVESRLPADPFLVACFERFYQELVDCKSGLPGHSSHIRGTLTAGDVHERLAALLTEQEEQVSRSSTLLGMEMYRQAQRVMACFADEIFAGVSWPAGTSWQSLEMQLFEADKRYGLSPDGPCMQKVEPLLQQDDPAYRELAAVYFYALALTETLPPASSRYWQPLAEMIGGAGGKMTESGRVFGQSYAHTLAENRVGALPAAEKWWLTLAVIVLLWLAGSWFLWTELSYPIDRELGNIHPHTLSP
jgi:hypothetical protein